MNAGIVQGGDFAFGAAALAADDGAGMSHAPAGGRRQPGDKTDHRFGDLFPDKSGRLFFGVAADFADHDNAAGVGVFLKSVQAVDEVGAVDRVAADADTGGLAYVLAGQLVDHLVGQGPGTGNHADGAAGLMNIAGHDADFGLAGRDNAGAVGADQP